MIVLPKEKGGACHFVFPPVISKRSEKSCLSSEIWPCGDLFLAVEMTAGAGHDDREDKSRRQREISRVFGCPFPSSWP